jgi:hypothetical protein
MAPHSPPVRVPLIGLLAVTLASSATAVAVVAGPAAPASAATTCAQADPFTRQALLPTAFNVNAKFGAASVTADFNGDHIADLALGAPGDLVGTAAGGSVTVYLGSATGLGTPRRITQSNVPGMGPEAGDKFGVALAAGDFNGDGKADLAVGAPGESIGTVTNAGSVVVFVGTTTGPAASGTPFNQDTAGDKAETNDQYGSALAAGNFFGDAKAELAVGAPGETPGTKTVAAGAVNVGKWGTSGLVAGVTLSQGTTGVGADEAGDRYGAALAAGNVTGDGKDDLLIGAPGEAIGDATQSGALNVYPGGASAFGTAFTANQTGGVETGDLYGSSIAVGDFDKTGGADIAVGVPGEVVTLGTAPNQTNTKAGAVQVTRGPISSGVNGGTYRVDEHTTGETLHAGDRWGATLAAGDVDADGYPDLLVGVPGFAKFGATNGGAVFLARGQRSSATGLQRGRLVQQADVLAGSEASDEFGSTVAIGDFDGNARAEVVIGVQGEVVSPNPRTGSAAVLTDVQPAATNRAVEQYAQTAAVQTPGIDGRIGPIRYAFVDNLGGPHLTTQVDPDNANSGVIDNRASLEATFTGRPAIGQGSDGKGVVAVRSTAGAVWVRSETAAGGTVWGDWIDYGGPDVSGLTAATLDNGRVGIFGIGAKGELVVLPQNVNGTFGGWQGTGVMGLTGDPVLATVAGGTRVFARDTDGNLHTALYAGLALTGCTTVGDAQIIGTPSVVVYPGSRLRVFASTADHALLTIGQDTAGSFEPTWSTVQPTDVAGSPAAVLDPVSGKITVVARGTDNVVYGATEQLQGSVTWGTWSPKTADGAPAFTDVTMVPYTNGAGAATYLFTYRDQNNSQRLWTADQAGSAALAQKGAARTYSGKVLKNGGRDGA